MLVCVEGSINYLAILDKKKTTPKSRGENDLGMRIKIGILVMLLQRYMLNSS